MNYISSLIDRLIVSAISRPAVASALEARGFATKAEVVIAMKDADETAIAVSRSLEECLRSLSSRVEEVREEVIDRIDDAVNADDLDDRIECEVGRQLDSFDVEAACSSAGFALEADVERSVEDLDALIGGWSVEDLARLGDAIDRARARVVQLEASK